MGAWEKAMGLKLSDQVENAGSERGVVQKELTRAEARG